MTDRLYHTDARSTRFTASVLATSTDGCVVYLDRSAFYPTSGGQPHDIGVLGGVAVVDVIDEAERVGHVLAEPLGVPPGAMVVGEIDWARRYDHMQQHSGQHVLSALLADEYDWPTLSVHFGDVASTVDVATDRLDLDELVEIERRANVLITAQHAVTVSFEDAATATGLRKASDREGTLRIVTIDDVDRSACGGTHVANTGEIGVILLRRTEKIKGAMRIEFLCGPRAIRRARADFTALTHTARALSAAPDDVPALVAQQQLRITELERAQKQLRLTIGRFEAQSLWAASAPDSDGIRRIAVTTKAPVKESEPLAQQLIALGQCVVLVTDAGNGGVLLATAEDTTHDAGTALRAALEPVGGRGGGSPRVAQGAVPDPSRLDDVCRALGFPVAPATIHSLNS